MDNLPAIPETNRVERWVNIGYKGGIILVLLLSAIYALSPVDLIPDVLIGAGQIDDLAVITAGGGSVALATILRTLLIFGLRNRRLRTGCLLFSLISGLILILISALTFWGLYHLMQEL